MLKDFFYLGKITKVFGLKGELLVYLDTDEPKKYHQLESVFFDMQGEPIPFFIQSVKIKSDDQLIVKFEDVDAENSYQFVNISLFLPLAMLPVLEGNKFYYHEVKGFKILDVVYGDLGICEDILEYPHQAIFQIKHPQGEILIPIVDEFILKVDKTNQIIEIKTPPGLIDLYIKNNNNS